MEDGTLLPIDLNQRGCGNPPLAFGFVGYMIECAVHCLESQGHQHGTALHLRGVLQQEMRLRWKAPKQNLAPTMQDEEVTTEHGAYAIALACMHTLTDYRVVGRTRKGPGFDFQLQRTGVPFDEQNFYANTCGLEVSGIRSGARQDVRRRKQQKIRQVVRGGDLLAAYVFIVEFGMPAGLIDSVQR